MLCLGLTTQELFINLIAILMTYIVDTKVCLDSAVYPTHK